MWGEGMEVIGTFILPQTIQNSMCHRHIQNKQNQGTCTCEARRTVVWTRCLSYSDGCYLLSRPVWLHMELWLWPSVSRSNTKVSFAPPIEKAFHFSCSNMVVNLELEHKLSVLELYVNAENQTVVLNTLHFHNWSFWKYLCAVSEASCHACLLLLCCFLNLFPLLGISKL